ncbi:MAG: putative nucleotidyltransferase component of viral defense system [Chlamydiales bacterium]|jgi:predicted nucleotidyltransferase component of viral defense system
MTNRFKSATDFRKSLEARLKDISAKTGEDLQRIRRKVAFDRFLTRIFSSQKGASNFLLKGGYAMELRFDTARATKDIDLTYLGRFNGSVEKAIEAEILEELRIIARLDLEDFFVYQIGESQLDLENAPYGGARYPVVTLIDGRRFVNFKMDVGLDILVNQVEKIKGHDWLDFCQVSAPEIPMITIEQQFAEKLHAYTLPREGLIDIVLLINKRSFDLSACRQATNTVFKVRSTHSLPEKLLPPPEEWDLPYQRMAQECSIDLNISSAFEEMQKIHRLVRQSS